MVGIVMGEWLMLLGLSRQTSVVVACVMMFVLWVIDSTSLSHAVALRRAIASTLAWAALAATLFATGRFPSSARWRLAHAGLALLLPSACWFALVAAYRQGLDLPDARSSRSSGSRTSPRISPAARFGKRKLAPAISPGKTWAGAVGGAVATLALAVVGATVPSLADSFFAVLEHRWSLVGMLAVTFCDASLSVVGDLFESHLKRQRGVKDSSHLLPGHGGVFDRIDALLPIVPVALLLGLTA